MIVLGFDTATPSTAVGLIAGGHALEARDDPAPGGHPGHATRLLPMAAGLLARADIGFAAVERIAVGLGPGGFTGLRVGLATARGLAQSLGCELAGVSSLGALAQAAWEARGGGDVPEGTLALIDARRGEVFAAAYESEARELLAPRALAPEQLPQLLAAAAERVEHDGGWLAVGDGAVRYRSSLESAGARVPEEDSSLHRLSALALCRLGARAAPLARAELLTPDYRRRPDAELALEAAAAGVGDGG